MKKFCSAISLAVILLFSVQIFAADTLIYSVCLVRHGDRTPWSDAAYKNINYKWPYALGELTPRGMNQEYNLGSIYRKKYVEQLHFLPEQYSPSTIYVLSTAMNRTIMSAECLLDGLYPAGTGPKLADGKPALPGGQAAIPIFSIPAGPRNMLNREQDDNEAPALLIAATLQQPYFIKEQERYADDLKRWGSIMGTSFKNMRDLLGASDYINCMIEDGAQLPKGLSREDANKMINAGFVNQAEVYTTYEVARYMGGEFMKRLNSDLRQAADGKQKYKLSLFLGHDITILPVMTAIGHPLATNPPYAAHVEFDLFKTDSGKYIVKATYNSVPLKFGKASKDYCTLDEFSELTRPYTFQ